MEQRHHFIPTGSYYKLTRTAHGLSQARRTPMSDILGCGPVNRWLLREDKQREEREGCEDGETSDSGLSSGSQARVKARETKKKESWAKIASGEGAIASL